MPTAILSQPINRRIFIRNSAIALFAATLAQTAVARATVFAASPAESTDQWNVDMDILNYALTLEHLEAEAYRVANSNAWMSGTAANYFQDFGAHENSHVEALTKLISDSGGTPVTKAATYHFPDITNSQEALTFFQSMEELGAAAYLGQVPRLADPNLITAAASIHNVEAQHAAALSDLLGVEPSPAFAQPKSMDEVMAVVSPFIMASGQMPKAMPRTGRGSDFVRKGIMARIAGY